MVTVASIDVVANFFDSNSRNGQREEQPITEKNDPLINRMCLQKTLHVLLAGNVLVILVILFNSDLHDAYHYFIASYATSDILTAVAFTPG